MVEVVLVLIVVVMLVVTVVVVVMNDYQLVICLYVCATVHAAINKIKQNKNIEYTESDSMTYLLTEYNLKFP